MVQREGYLALSEEGDKMTNREVEHQRGEVKAVIKTEGFKNRTIDIGVQMIVMSNRKIGKAIRSIKVDKRTVGKDIQSIEVDKRTIGKAIQRLVVRIQLIEIGIGSVVK